MKTSLAINPIISIVILNYNSGEYLSECLASIQGSNLNTNLFEVIVVDNNSTDQSIKGIIPLTNLKLLKLKTNLGFSHGNNQGVKLVNKNSRYVFFLNPDTTIEKSTLENILETFSQNPDIDAISPYVILAKTQKLQPECHRGFPYPLRSLMHFLKISDRGYFQTHLDTQKSHPIEAGVGAAIIIKKSVGEKIKWWDEDYFMYGEDLQLSWDIQHNGFHLWFIPNIRILHFQGISSGINSNSRLSASKISPVTPEVKKRSILATTQAMRLFHQKNLASQYPAIVNKTIYLGIFLLEKLRLSKI